MTQLFADDSQDGTCSILRVVTLHGDGSFDFVVHLERDLLLGQQLEQTLEMDLKDAGNGLFRDRREGYDLGETAQEFRTEIVLHDVHQVVVLRYLALIE